MKFVRLFLIFLIFFLSGQLVWAYTCSGDDSCVGGDTPEVGFCISGGDCSIKCAAACGKLTKCWSIDQDECDTCCAGEMCVGYGGFEEVACMNACAGTCITNGHFCNSLNLLRIIAVGIAVVLFSINGVRWMISDNDQTRIEARGGMLWVFFGLTVIMVATALVNYILMGDLVC